MDSKNCFKNGLNNTVSKTVSTTRSQKMVSKKRSQTNGPQKRFQKWIEKTDLPWSTLEDPGSGRYKTRNILHGS